MLKIYPNGEQFIAENADIFRQFPLETVFFEANAKYMSQTNNNNFLLKLANGNKYLLAVHNGDHPMVIFGNNELCSELARDVLQLQLSFNQILGDMPTCEAFLAEYEHLTGVTHRIKYAMEIMQCKRLLTKENLDGVEIPTEKDVDELAQMMLNFHGDALGENVTFTDMQREAMECLHNFVVVRHNGQIVSCACMKRATDYLASISNVFTRVEYRGKGFACRAVTYLTKRILDSGKLPYLFVDTKNPISNHLYTKIGYTYAIPQYHIGIER